MTDVMIGDLRVNPFNRLCVVIDVPEKKKHTYLEVTVFFPHKASYDFYFFDIIKDFELISRVKCDA